jgi:hypothetical protein
MDFSSDEPAVTVVTTGAGGGVAFSLRPSCTRMSSVKERASIGRPL